VLKALRSVVSHWIARGEISIDPTIGVRLPKYKSDGHRTWADEDIEAFKATHSEGTRARLAMQLLLDTAQRSSDVVRMGPQHVRNGMIHVKQRKTKTELALPIHPDLQTLIGMTQFKHLTFLTTKWGRPFSPRGFGNCLAIAAKKQVCPRDVLHTD
jgi:integrase